MSNIALTTLIIGGVLLFIIGSLISSIEEEEKKRKKEKDHLNAEESPQKKNIHSSPDYIGYIETLPTVKVGQIIDGDTVDIFYKSTKTRVRLSGIDCPEDGQEWGDMATFGLIKLIGGRKHVKLHIYGLDKYGRTLGTFYVYESDKEKWINVNERMVTLGHAWVMRRYYTHLPLQQQKRLDQLERWAKSKQIGLWGSKNPLAPWLWRQNKARVCG